MSLADTRFDQMFPVLDAGCKSRPPSASPAPRRGRFAPGELVYDVGVRNAPAWLVLDGGLEIMRRDGLHRQTSVVLLAEGQFSGEVSQLGRPRHAWRSAQAGPEGCTALPFDAAHIRALVIGSAELGEIVMRAFILRRVGADPGGRRRLAADRPARLARSGAARRLSVAQRLSLHGARRGLRRGGARGGRAFRRAAGRTAADDLPQRLVPEAADRRRSRRCVSASRRSSIRRPSTTSRWSAPDPPVLPPRSMARRKACR